MVGAVGRRWPRRVRRATSEDDFRGSVPVQISGREGRTGPVERVEVGQLPAARVHGFDLGAGRRRGARDDVGVAVGVDVAQCDLDRRHGLRAVREQGRARRAARHVDDLHLEA